MINKRNSCDGSRSVFTNVDEKVRDWTLVWRFFSIINIIYNVRYLPCLNAYHP